MPAFTARTGMYLPGGGSQSIGGEDEVADVDRINLNMQKLDTLVGAPSSTTFPDAPFDGQLVRVKGDVYAWSDGDGKWSQVSPHVGTTPPDSPQEGYLWVDTN